MTQYTFVTKFLGFRASNTPQALPSGTLGRPRMRNELVWGRDQLRFKVETQDSVGPMEFTNLIVIRGRRKGLSVSRISQARIGPFLVFEMPSRSECPLPPAPTPASSPGSSDQNGNSDNKG